MKLLFISNISKGVGSFSLASILSAKELGIEYHLAANFYGVHAEELEKQEKEYGVYLHQIDFVRNPLSLSNRKTYQQIVELINEEKIDIIHCNTPVGGVVGRLAGKKCKISKVIYQAHGFHFYKGAPAINWLIYYPIERMLAHFTDTLITINHEDYERTQKFHLRDHGKVYYVPGVGIDTKQYEPRDFQRNKKREEIGLKKDDIMVISAGDLIERKNYKTSIEAIAKADDKNLQYFICGQGSLRDELEELSKRLNVEYQVHFLGFRTDIKELFLAADIFLFTTYQEGLPRSLSEAMAAGLPCVVSNIRGNVDLIQSGVNGYLHDANDVSGFSSSLQILAKDEVLRRNMGEGNKAALENFSLSAVKSAIRKIYECEANE